MSLLAARRPATRYNCSPFPLPCRTSAKRTPPLRRPTRRVRTGSFHSSRRGIEFLLHGLQSENLPPPLPGSPRHLSNSARSVLIHLGSALALSRSHSPVPYSSSTRLILRML